MPLLVAEIVRCSENLEFSSSLSIGTSYREDSFRIQKCWDPSPLCHEPVRFRRTLRKNVTNGIGEREYAARTEWGDEGFIKPATEEAAAQDEQKRHRFPDPASVGPIKLGRELVSLLSGEREIVLHTDMKRSTKELLLWRRQHLLNSSDDGSSQCVDESAFLRSCLESLILGADDVNASKLARRVGYMLLDVFDGLNREYSLDQSGNISSQECSNWVKLLAEGAHDSERWEFLNLVLKAIDLTLSADQVTRWGDLEKSGKFSFLDKLCAARSARWNAVVVESIRVFRIGELIPGQQRLKPTEDGQKVRNIFAEFVEQGDWRSAERLAIVVQDYDIMQTLYKHLSLLNMTKALKRLQKVGTGAQSTLIEPPLASIVQTNGSLVVGETAPTLLGSPIDHTKNRSLNEKNGLEFTWKYVDSPEAIDAVVLHLMKCDSAVCDDDFNEQAVSGEC